MCEQSPRAVLGFRSFQKAVTGWMLFGLDRVVLKDFVIFGYQKQRYLDTYMYLNILTDFTNDF